MQNVHGVLPLVGHNTGDRAVSFDLLYQFSEMKLDAVVGEVLVHVFGEPVVVVTCQACIFRLEEKGFLTPAAYRFGKFHADIPRSGLPR
jgi:hypothetical protein